MIFHYYSKSFTEYSDYFFQYNKINYLKMLRSPLIKLLGTGAALSASSTLAFSSSAAVKSDKVPKVYFDIAADGKPMGRIVMEVSVY